MKPASLGKSMVMRVPDTTSLPLGSRDKAVKGLSQAESAYRHSPTATTVGMAIRSRRTQRLCRRAMRNCPLAIGAGGCAPGMRAGVGDHRCAHRFLLLPDESGFVPRPYSYGRVRVAFEYGWAAAAALRMGKDVLGRPTGQIEPRAIGQKTKARLGERVPSFPGQ